LSRVVLATDHGKVGAGKIGIDHRAGGRVYDVDIAGEQRLDRSSTRTDVKQLHVGAVFLVQTCIFADPKNGESSGKCRIRDAQLWRLGVGQTGTDRGECE